MDKKKRIIYLIIGNILIGIGVGLCRLAAMGVDPYSCQNLSLSLMFSDMGLRFMTFGTCQFILNIIIFVVVICTMRFKYIGAGTLLNMVGVGYIADAVCFLFDKTGITLNLMGRIILLAAGMLVLTLGVAMYMLADMGIAPYDTIAYIIMKYSKDKISFRVGRILTDLFAVLVGVVVCIVCGRSILAVLGVGTVASVVFNGPLIQWFKERLYIKDLHK